MTGLAVAAISFVLTIAAMQLLVRVAPRLGLVDHPDTRKHHEGSVPLVGGLALYLVLMLLYSTGIASAANAIPLLIAASIITLIGLLDDRRHISPRLRLFFHLLVALVVVYGAGIRLDHLGAITPGGELLKLGILATAVTVFGIMSVINAMNFIDGLDGLAGGVAFIALSGLWAIFALTGQTPPDLIPVMSGGLAAFLIYNGRWFGRKKAALFLGDAGSTLLGMLMAAMLIEHSQGDNAALSPVVALWLLAIPLVDFLATVVRRLLMRQHPFCPDREHLHHVLIRITQHETSASHILLATSLAYAAIGVVGQIFQWPMQFMFYTFIALFIVGYWLLRNSWGLAGKAKLFSTRKEA